MGSSSSLSGGSRGCGGRCKRGCGAGDKRPCSGYRSGGGLHSCVGYVYGGRVGCRQAGQRHRSLQGRRVGGCLIDYQVADDAWIGVGNVGAGTRQRIVGVGNPEDRVAVPIIEELLVQQLREVLIRGAEVGLPPHQVVQTPVDRAQAKRQP